MIVGFRKQKGRHPPNHITGSKVEKVSSFKVFGVQISEDLSGSVHFALFVF